MSPEFRSDSSADKQRLKKKKNFFFLSERGSLNDLICHERERDKKHFRQQDKQKEAALTGFHHI